MNNRNNQPLIQSWIPPDIGWTIETSIFCIEIPVNDPDIVQFISTGEVTIKVPSKKCLTAANAMRNVEENKELRFQLEHAVLLPKKLKPLHERVKVGMDVVAYCYGVFHIVDKNVLCVLVGRSRPSNSENRITTELKAKADLLVSDYMKLIADFKIEIMQKKLKIDEFYSGKDKLNKLKNIEEILTDIEERGRKPELRINDILEFIPLGVIIQNHSISASLKLKRSAIKAVAESGYLPSRDGYYNGIFLKQNGKRNTAILSWVPHNGLPPYPEIRWTVQRRIPSALYKPRNQEVFRPTLNSGTQSITDFLHVGGFEPWSDDLGNALNNIDFDYHDINNRVEKIREDLKYRGFEAIAWFQSYHIWTDETWGIYIDSNKLDDLAYSLFDDFNAHHVSRSFGLAAVLAFGLTYSHELFHARVEAALSWMELNASKAMYLRYKKNVYDVLRETPRWLEEALANWWAWAWFIENSKYFVKSKLEEKETIKNLVKMTLDLSPPGYQEWRLGDDREIWRTFLTQLISGSPKIPSSGMGLPLESALKGPLPFDLIAADIPLYFVGEGIIANRLQTHPATFNVPSKREIEKALRYYKYTPDSSGGKGGHQKWTGPDQRAFILPTRDPVSIGVFKSFLHHIGIDKATYVHKVRPSI